MSRNSSSVVVSTAQSQRHQPADGAWEAGDPRGAEPGADYLQEGSSCPLESVTHCNVQDSGPWRPAACWPDAVQVSTGGEGSVGSSPMCPAQAWPTFHVLLHRAPHTGTVLTVQEERMDAPVRDEAGEVTKRNTR